jgi:hypothetical protein
VVANSVHSQVARAAAAAGRPGHAVAGPQARSQAQEKNQPRKDQDNEYQ